MTIQELHPLRIDTGLTQVRWTGETKKRTGVAISPSRLSMAINGHIELRDEELGALENTLRAVIRERQSRFNKIMAGAYGFTGVPA